MVSYYFLFYSVAIRFDINLNIVSMKSVGEVDEMKEMVNLVVMWTGEIL